MLLVQELIALLRVMPKMFDVGDVIYAGASQVRSWGCHGEMVHARKDGDTVILSGNRVAMDAHATYYITCNIEIIS